MIRVLIAVLLMSAQTAWGLEITNVRHAPQRIDLAKGERVTVQFHLSEAAQCTLNVYDGRERLILKTETPTPLAAGEQSLTWDGRDQKGRAVPPEAYHYTLDAEDSHGTVVHYDVSDLAGEVLNVRDVKWDPRAHLLRYVLTGMGRVRIRVGLANNGPLLRTVIDWVPRLTGPHAQAWDGKDASGELDLTQHPQLALVAEAFTLPTNTILVGPDTDTVNLIQDEPRPGKRRTVQTTPKRRMFAYTLQPIDQRHDFKVRLELPAGTRRNAKGLPVLTGRVPVHIDVPAQDRPWVLANRFEPVFFVDGQYVFEIEGGYLPLTWMWDSRGITEGIHYITANLRGYDGNFGIATQKVYIKFAGSTP